MEARVEQFHTDARRPRDAKTEKDIKKLRQFMFKNQEYRFTELSKTYLFQAVQCYVTAYSAECDDNPAVPLLQDALAMRQTVFSTAHKKSMLKWLDKLSPQTAGHREAGAAAPSTSFHVIDLSDADAELMDAEGNTRTVPLGSLAPELLEALRGGFDSEGGVCVTLGGDERSIQDVWPQ